MSGLQPTQFDLRPYYRVTVVNPDGTLRFSRDVGTDEQAARNKAAFWWAKDYLTYVCVTSPPKDPLERAMWKFDKLLAQLH
jgi:hypothetical protein